MKSRAFRKALANDVCNVIDWLVTLCDNELSESDKREIKDLEGMLRDAAEPKLRPMSEMTEWEKQQYGELNSECVAHNDVESYAQLIDFFIERGLDYNGTLNR